MKQCKDCLRECSIHQQIILNAGIACAKYGRKDSCYGFLDLDLPEYIRQTLPADYITCEEGMSRTVLDLCIRGTVNGQSAADMADMLREVAEKEHTRRAEAFYSLRVARGVCFLCCMDLH